jgi:hypothetical protein
MRLSSPRKKRKSLLVPRIQQIKSSGGAKDGRTTCYAFFMPFTIHGFSALFQEFQQKINTFRAVARGGVSRIVIRVPDYIGTNEASVPSSNLNPRTPSLLSKLSLSFRSANSIFKLLRRNLRQGLSQHADVVGL